MTLDLTLIQTLLHHFALPQQREQEKKALYYPCRMHVSETGHVSDPDDSDDRQEFNERLSKILFDLQDDGSELSGGESESEEESKEDSRAESKQVPFEPVISDSEDYFVVDLSDFPNEYEDGTDGADTGEETVTLLEIISETLFYRVQNMWTDVKGAIHQHFLSTGVTLIRWKK